MTADKEKAYKELTIPFLKEELKNRGLPVGGNKPELIARLLQHDASSAKSKSSKAKSSKEEAPKAKAKKPSKSEGAVSKSKSKKAEAAKSHESDEEPPKARPKAKAKKVVKPAEAEEPPKSRSKAKVKTKPVIESVEESPKSKEKAPKTKSSKTKSKEEPPKETSKSQEEVPKTKRKEKAPKAKGEEEPKPQIEIQVVEKVIEKIIEHPRPFSDPIPSEYEGKVFRVTSEQLYDAFSRCSLTGELFVALSTFEEVPIRPSWNEDVKAPVDSDGFVYDDKVQMVIGRLEDGKVRSLTQKEALNLENKRILVLRHLGELKPVESSSESQETQESVESEQDSEIDEGKSEGEEIEGRFDATVGKFTEAVSKSFKGGIEDVEVKKTPVLVLTEREQLIADLIKSRITVKTSVLFRIVRNKIKDVSEDEIDRVKALLPPKKR